MGPTWPNRDFMYAASSYGVTAGDERPFCGVAGTGIRALTCVQREFFDRDTVIFDELTRRNISWKFFVDGPPTPRLAATLSATQMAYRWGLTSIPDHIGGSGSLLDKLEKGDPIPAVSFIDASVSEDARGNDEHPPADLQIGQDFTARFVNAVTRSKYWADSVLFLTYDEHGGIFDHVPPPKACEPDPDNTRPILNEEDHAFFGEHDELYTRFDVYGMRVPFVVVSPFAKRSYVSHNVYDHTSILRFIEAKFRLPALSSRDANADALFDVFDFNANDGRGPWATPPVMPTGPYAGGSGVDPAGVERCVQLYPRSAMP
jgi:phospholipase C